MVLKPNRFVVLYLMMLTISISLSAQHLRIFDKQERLRIKDLFLRNQKIFDSSRADRIRILRIVPEETGPKVRIRNIAAVYLIDYDSLIAYCANVDPDSGQVLDTFRLRGTPGASPEEMGEARALMLQNRELAELIRNAARVEGGFVVPPPREAPLRGRYLKFHILGATVKELARKVIVDVANARVYPQ
jgi:hypothetical protein